MRAVDERLAPFGRARARSEGGPVLVPRGTQEFVITNWVVGSLLTGEGGGHL